MWLQRMIVLVVTNRSRATIETESHPMIEAFQWIALRSGAS